MSDEPEARMWDEGSARYESHGAYFESAFASSEHLDRAPLLADDAYTEVTMVPVGDAEEEHCHWKCKSEPPSAIPQLLAALVLCALFMLCELIGGYAAGSLSVMSDAAHMLSDCGGFALALLAFYCARRPPDAHMSYGYKRAEVLGAMVSVLLIWLLTGIFVYVAAGRLQRGEYGVEADMMLLVSGAGVGFNVVLACVLHGCTAVAHHHTHGGGACAHGPLTAPAPPRSRFRLARRERKPANGSLNGDLGLKELAAGDVSAVSAAPPRNINLRAALIHVIGDLIQSCGVLLASIIIKFYPSAQFIDPVCTFIFSILVLVTSARVVRDALAILMQAVPAHFRYRELVAALSAIPGVRHVHSVHAWALSTHHVEVTAHVGIDDMSECERVLAACQRAARAHGAAAATVQVERSAPRPAPCPAAPCPACRQPAAPP